MMDSGGMSAADAARLDREHREQRIDDLRSEVLRLRELVAVVYAGLGAEHDLPEQWLDVLLAATEGKPFSTDGLLPYTRAPK